MANTDDNAEFQGPVLSGPGRDLAVAAVFGAFSLAGWFSVLSGKRLMASLGQGLDPGPAFLPVVVLGLLSLGSVLILIKGLYRLWRRRAAATQTPPETETETEQTQADGEPGGRRQHAYALLVLASLALLPSVIQAVGFAAGGFLFVAPWVIWLAWRRGARIGMAVFKGGVQAALICAFLYLTFIEILKVPLG